MEKVIVLKGATNKGKTATLHLLIDTLISRYGATIQTKHGYSPDIYQDCFVTLDVPEFGRVGVITYGDNGCQEDVENSLKICLNENCKAVLGASHMQYEREPKTVYRILWDFGRDQNAKVVETSPYIRDSRFGQPIDDTHLNTICAENLCTLLFRL